MAETKITKEQVKRVAHLCNLTLSEEEFEKFSQLLTDTLEYINVLDELDILDVVPTFQVTGLTNVYQQPDVYSSKRLNQEQALSNAKEAVKGLFATHAVFDRTSA